MADRRALAMARLEARLGHVFADRDLIERALTHASARTRTRADNESLEFLGDRVLGLVIADAVAKAHPDASAGELTRRLHGVTNGRACARIARTLDIGEALRLPGGETRRGARLSDTILGDACEAVIAALFRELGYARAARLIEALWAPLLGEPLDREGLDPKTALQEWAAAHGFGAPVYEVVERHGPAHAPTFKVSVQLGDLPVQLATAGAVREAEKAVALALLRHLREGS
ncbi:MAG TPA: ribonuclease III [Caulobacteraceae bacterium]